MCPANANPLHKLFFLSIGSNAHVVNDRHLFVTFTKFESHVGKAPQSMSVKGIGTVELEPESEDNEGAHKVMLHDVLYIPDYPCNVIGGPILTSNDHEHSVDFKTSKLVIAATGRVVGTFDTPLMQLRLRGNPELDFTEEVTRHLRILVTWPVEEQCRWKAHQAGEEFVQGSHVLEPPFSDAEKAWVKKNYSSEYSFLLQKSLSIHKQDERSLGRKLARKEMSTQAATVKMMASELKQENAKIAVMQKAKTDQKLLDETNKENEAQEAVAQPRRVSALYVPMHMRVIQRRA